MNRMHGTPHSNLLSKIKFTYGSIRGDTLGDTAKCNVNSQKQVTSSTNKNPSTSPVKSGEIFRTDCGKFSFACTYCGSVWRNCDLLMVHINSHFKPKKENGEKAELPLALPEFVSIGEVKIEPGMETAIVSNGKTVDRYRPAPAIVPRDLKLIPRKLTTTDISKLSATTTTTIQRDSLTPAIGPNASKATPKTLNTTDISKLPPTTRIVRIVKRTNDLSVAMALLESDSTEAINSGDKSMPYRTRKILKVVKRKHSTDDSTANAILKLKRVKPNPKASTANKKPSVIHDLTSDLEVPVVPVVQNINSETKSRIAVKPLSSLSQPKLNVHSSNGKDSEPQMKVSVRPCSHCEREPKIQRPSDPRQHKCTICPVWLPNHDQFDFHIKNIHKSSGKPIVSVAQPNVGNNNNEQESDVKRNVLRLRCYQCEMEPKVQRPCNPRRHRCFLCPVWFPNHDEFYLHVKDIHKRDPATEAQQHYYCYACESRFSSRQQLTFHVKSHQETKETTETHLCAICGSCFDTKKKFLAHMDGHSERKFKCDRCGKTFKGLGILRQHLLYHQDCNASHICEICSKAFRFGKYLKRHMAVHDGPKISCRHCNAKFHFESVRRVHEQTRHNVH